MALASLLRLLRVKQWIKNSFVFFPLLFSGNLFTPSLVGKSLLTFVSYCLVASSVYIFNDLIDFQKDRLHPKKAKRVLIHDQVNKGVIVVLMLGLLGAGLWMGSRINGLVVLSMGFYVLVNLVYNLITKHVVILDVIFIATGFYLRILTGAFAIAVLPSVWLQMCVFILALFLGFTKRRHEMTMLKARAQEHRAVLAHYTAYLLDQLIMICSTLAIVFYGLYTISPEIIARIGGYQMVYSVTFVIYGIFRYLYLIHVKKLGDDPGEVLLSDVP
ncbi:MAG: hypothetical protein A2Y04_06265, partial [Omnitrophica WOR_2 bacterium GWC2_45_7]